MTVTAEDKIITDLESNYTNDAAGESAAGDEQPGTSEQPAVSAAEAAATLRIVKGNPTDSEIAALVAVLAAAASTGGSEGDGKPAETWGDPTRMHRQWAPFSPYSYPNLG